MASANLRAVAFERAERRSVSTPSFPLATSLTGAKLRACVATAGGASALAGRAAAAETASSASEGRSGPRMGLEKDGPVIEVEQQRRVVARGDAVDIRGARVRHPLHARPERERPGELVPDRGPPDVSVLPGERRAGAGRVPIEDPLEVEGELLDRPDVQARDDRPVETRVEIAVRDVLHPDAPGIGLVGDAAADEKLVAERDARRGGAVRLPRRRADRARRSAGNGAAEDERRGRIRIAQQRGRDGGGEAAAEPGLHLASDLVVQDPRRAVVEEVRREELVLEAGANGPAEPVRDLERGARHLVVGVRVGRGPVRARVVVAAEREIGLEGRIRRVKPVGVRVALDRVVEDVVGPASARVQLEPIEAAVDQLAFECVLGGARLAPAHAGVQPQAARQMQAVEVVLRLAIGGIQLRGPAQRRLRIGEPAQRLLRPADVLPAVGRLAGDGHLGLVGIEGGLVVALLAQGVGAGAHLVRHNHAEWGSDLGRPGRGVACAGGLARLRVRDGGSSQAAGEQCDVQAHRPFLQASSSASSTSLADSTLAPSRAFTSRTAGVPSPASRMSRSMGPSSPRERAAPTPSSATSPRSTRSTPTAFPTRPSLRPVLRSTTAAGTLRSRSTNRLRSYSSPGRNSCQTTSSGLAHARSAAPRWTNTPRPPRPNRGFDSSGNPSAPATSRCGVLPEKVTGTATPARSRFSAVRSLSFATSTPGGSEMQREIPRSRKAARMRATTGSSSVTVDTTSAAFSGTAIARRTATKRGSRADGTNRKSSAGDSTSLMSVPTTRYPLFAK